MIQDEDIYTFFEPELPTTTATIARANSTSPANGLVSNLYPNKNGCKVSCSNTTQPSSASEKKTCNNGNGTGWWSAMRDKMTVHEGSSVLDLKSDNYFSCAVGRKRSSARYLLGSSAEVVSLLKELAEISPPN